MRSAVVLPAADCGERGGAAIAVAGVSVAAAINAATPGRSHRVPGSRTEIRCRVSTARASSAVVAAKTIQASQPAAVKSPSRIRPSSGVVRIRDQSAVTSSSR